MIRLKGFSWAIVCLFITQNAFAQQSQFQINGFAQGTTYAITYYSSKEIVIKKEIDSLLVDIDQSMSIYKRNSDISNFNAVETDCIVVDSYLQDVLRFAFKTYKESNGLFDITVKPLVSLWGFGPEKVINYPDSAKVSETLNSVGMDKLVFSKNKLCKKAKGISIDVNGIAQGYSVDVVAKYLSKRGIKDYIVEIGGEVVARGVKPNQENFRIAVQRPGQENNETNYIIELKNKAITTSGSYEKFRMYKSQKISHHINPKTGYPFTSSILSATVIANTGMESDALDNVLIAMHPDEAIRFANSRKKIDIYLIYEENGILKEGFSKGFSKYISPN
ncbi:FAD:protein FMN transferase [Sphingobacterium hungaricum]|uniref:FAD:protein FMN transferase n=1 Tax=Sphingobacterium hungaricum TaxID=2082723 RepID=A0A928UVI2_9SPHI|nr:FAD:protein FMN transferase [Sphingobacterium hungaricum]MBE8712296.1 FAD:protein FMN transferase [Sphingobacterium hungaricum]